MANECEWNECERVNVFGRLVRVRCEKLATKTVFQYTYT